MNIPIVLTSARRPVGGGWRLPVWLVLLLLANSTQAAATLPSALLSVTTDGSTQDYSVNLQLLLLLTALTFLPALLMATTSFARILIVLAILKQAVGLQQVPPSRLLIGIALILTFFVMRPVLDEIWAQSVEPYMAETLSFRDAAKQAALPLHAFMRRQTRKNDLQQFMVMAGDSDQTAAEDVPLTTLIPAFLCSELKTGFQMGFLIFLPFLVIDLLVASILMALGMIMLSPLIISLPFKLMLFVLVDGWTLVIASTVRSFSI